ncbi:MAG: PD-(D/E)XK nuclease family protein [Flavobacteriales bacterium]|nr:PD-(D/E)XK nuclease family protein [Flavobacteriales bacterium]
MIKKIDRIIQHLLKQKKYIEKKLLLVSFNDSLIEYFKEKYQKYGIFTEIYTMEKLLEKISGLSSFHKSYILFYFFYILKKRNSYLSRSFNDFLKWAPDILNDFQDLDLNLINIEYFFTYIISTEKIKKWNPNNIEKNLVGKNNLFWNEIYKSYKILQDILLKKGIGYNGMIFRIAIHRLKNFLSNNLDTRIILFFSRFHLLNKCEKIFIKKIIQLDKGSIYNLNLEEKNMLIKKISDLCIKKKTSINNINPNKIKIIRVSKEVEQVKIVEKLVHQLIQNGKKPNQIVLILGDKYLTIPLLYSIKNILGIPISIFTDFPLKTLPIHHTFHSIFQLLLKKEKMKNFYGKDILRVLYDGYIQKFFIKKNLSFLDEFNKYHSNFVSESIMNKYLFKNINNKLNIIFQIPTYDTKKCIIGLMSFITEFKILLCKNAPKHLFELKFLSKLEVYMQKLKILVRKTETYFFGIKDIFNIYQQFIKTEKISYICKDTKGLHIRVFMDSYFENFENTIMTSVNEGFIPPDKKIYNTFIPLDIRNKLNFSIFQENEEIYCHYFIKILNNSKNTYLIYKNKPDELNSGEKSRFIHQIEMNSNFSMEKKNNFTFNLLNSSKKNPFVIKKTKSMIRRLYEIADQGLSPSSILLYNYNPLSFYYKKVLGLKNIEKKSIKQETGKIIHKILEVLYHPIKGNFITLDWINKMKNNYEYITKNILSKTIKSSFLEGKNIFLYSIIKNYIQNFINWEEKLVHQGHKIFLKEIEIHASTRLDIGFHQVNLYGIIDRIDEYNGMTRIIDYKIGISQKQKIHISLDKIENIFQDPNHGNTMQLLIYMYLLWFKSGYKKKSTIISLVSPEKHKKDSILTIPINFFHQKKNNITYESYVKIFLPHLIKRISEILDPKIPIQEKINRYV